MENQEKQIHEMQKSTLYIDKRLNELAKKHGLNKSHLARKAISDMVANLEIQEEMQKEYDRLKRIANLQNQQESKP